MRCRARGLSLPTKLGHTLAVSPLDPEQLDFIRRHSRVHLDREGRWTFDGRPVENDRVATLFHQGTRLGDEAGEFILQVGEQWCYLEHVEDTAFFVARIHAAESVGLEATLLGGERLPLPVERLTQSGDTQVYVRFSDGRKARFLRDAVVSLGEYLCEEEGALGVRVGGRFYAVGQE